MKEGFKVNVLSPLEKLTEEVREIFRKEYKGIIIINYNLIIR